MQENELDTIEESFEAIPPEVQDYIYSTEFTEKLATLFSSITPVNTEAQNLFKGALFGYLSRNSSEEEFDEAITALAAVPQDKEKIIAWVSEHVSQKILSLISDAYNEEGSSGEDITPEALSSPTTPTRVLETLGARLNQSSVIVPSKRDYSMDTQSIEKPTVQNITPSVDPYRELPEK